ncbi:MAG TPA: Na-translocating system protein MpsC family protein [Candidatus Hydrogenedentes bacterium]|nr:Na-translocating system protein MpsC family protein [Candidatus Hydrogenedentota bacterium]HPG70183.1 Na-translocating system protein MpsC family protein [Candidatus Hydrogenedentota bacterium]
MAVLREMEARIVEAVAGFEREQMALHPTSIVVNLQSDTLFVMLQGITFPAARDCAQDEYCQGLLEEYYTRTFDAGKYALEEEIQEILNRAVDHSAMRVDSVAGNGVLQFMLGDSLDTL